MPRITDSSYETMTAATVPANLILYGVDPTDTADNATGSSRQIPLSVVQADKGSQVVNVITKAALADARTVTDGAITTGTATFTSATAAFTAADAGKAIEVPGAGAAGARLVTTILTYTNATTVTLATNAGTTVSGATTIIATNNATAIGAAVTSLPSTGGIVFFPPGNYATGKVTIAKANVTLKFANGVTITSLATADTTFAVTANNVQLIGRPTFVGGGGAANGIQFVSCTGGRVQGLFSASGYTNYFGINYLAHDFLLDGLRCTASQLGWYINGGRRQVWRNIKLLYPTGTVTLVPLDFNGNVTAEEINDLTLENVYISGLGGTQNVTALCVQRVPSLNRNKNISIRNVVVTDYDLDAIDVLHSDEVSIVDFKAIRCSVISILSSNVMMTNCLTYQALGAGFTIGDPLVYTTTRNVTLVNCQAISSGYGLPANTDRDRSGFTIMGNNVAHPGTNDIVNDVMLVGCRAYDDLTGNSGAGTQNYGVSIVGYANNVRALNCDFSGNLISPSYVDTTASLKITKVRIQANGPTNLNVEDFGAIGDSTTEQSGGTTSGSRTFTGNALEVFKTSDAAIVLTNAGTGYTNGTNYALGIAGGGGSGATGQFDVVGGAVTNVKVTAGGTGYTSAPAITFPGAGTPLVAATATANVTGGVLVGKTILIECAGVGSDHLVTTISTYVSTTTVNLTTAASVTLTSASYAIYRTDNTAAYARVMALAKSIAVTNGGQGMGVYVPSGVYAGTFDLSNCSNVTLFGDGPSSVLLGPVTSTAQVTLKVQATVRCNVHHLRIMGGNTGLYVYGNLRGWFKNLYISGQHRSTLASVSTLTSVTTTATAVTAAAHGYTTGDVVTIEGSNNHAYNGTWTITVTNSTTFTYTTARAPGGASTGTVTAIKASDGDAIYVNGDASTELLFENVYGCDFEGYGFDYTRLLSPDSGGITLRGVVMAMRSGTTGISGFRFVSNQTAGTSIFLYMFQCYADNFSSGPSFQFFRVTNFRASQLWGSTNLATRGCVLLSDCVYGVINTSWFDNQSTTGYVVELNSTGTGTSHDLIINGNHITGNTATSYGFFWSGTGTHLAVDIDLNSILGSPALTNNFTTYTDASSLRRVQPASHLTDANTGQWCWEDSQGTGKKFVRVNGNVLQFLNNAFTVAIANFYDDGGWKSGLDTALSADTAALTSLTAANITGMSFPVVASGTYKFEANLRATSSTTAGVKYAITFPAGGTMTADLIGNGATNVQSRLFDMLNASGTLSTTIFQQLAALGYQKITGVLKNGTNAGTLQLQYAKVTSGNVVFGAGSSLDVIREA